jgi:hypothetical protein
MTTRASADARAIAVVTATLRLVKCEILDSTTVWTFERGLYVTLDIEPDGSASWHLGIKADA